MSQAAARELYSMALFGLTPHPIMVRADPARRGRRPERIQQEEANLLMVYDNVHLRVGTALVGAGDYPRQPARR